MRPEEKWIELGYGDEVKKAPSRKAERLVSMSKLKTFEDCKKLAEEEAETNWVNYWPWSTVYSKWRTPAEVKNQIYVGKLAELELARRCFLKGRLAEAPKVFALKSREDYDFKIDDGQKVEVKMKEAQARKHHAKHPDVIAAWPADTRKLDGKYMSLK